VSVDPRAPASLDRVAVVYKRPLPYLYLAPAVFGGARIPYQTSDGSRWRPNRSRRPGSALRVRRIRFHPSLDCGAASSPHFAFEHEGRRVGAEEVRPSIAD